MSDIVADKSHDFQIFSGKSGEGVVFLLLRTADEKVSVFPSMESGIDGMVDNFQRVIDTVSFSKLDQEISDAELIVSFNYYVPDYVPLADIVRT